MGYSDRQDLLFSKIATMDLDSRVREYTCRGLEVPPLDQLLNDSEKKQLKAGDWKITDKELKTWRVVAVQENPKTQFSASIIDTGDGNASVAFRASQAMSSDTWKKTWTDADLKLLTQTQTKQQKDTEEFLKKNSALLNKYNNLDFTGHSLGGNLATHGTLIADKVGIDGKKIRCVSMDGPGFSDEYLKKHKDDIERMQGRITHYVWSPVGNMLSDVPGTDVRYPETKSYEDYKKQSGAEECGSGAYDIICKHDPLSVKLVDKDNINYSKTPSFEDGVAKGISLAADVVIPAVLFGPWGFFFPETCNKIYNTLTDAFLNVIGDFGTVAFKIKEFFDGTWYKNWKANKEKKAALEKATASCETDSRCYIQMQEFKLIAQECDSIAKDLNKVKKRLEKSYKLPGFFNSSRPDIPVIKQVLGMINTVSNKLNEWLTAAGKAKTKCASCNTRLKAISAYLTDTSYRFTTAEDIAVKEIDNWYGQSNPVNTINVVPMVSGHSKGGSSK